MKRKIKEYISLTFGLLSIYALCNFILPILDNVLGFKEAHELFIEEKIEAGAWFYIFVEKVGPSSENIRHSLKYNPIGKKYGN